jgi:multisubunit Na+/H+ antiporter MnhC subunit
MNTTASILVVILQVIGLGLFIWLILPYLRQEDWKNKFWHHPHAKALIITFAIIGLAILGFRILMDWLLPPLEVLK